MRYMHELVEGRTHLLIYTFVSFFLYEEPKMLMQELIDTTIHYYHIERGLAQGGMSEVYLARDMRTDQIVAMKMVKRSVGEYYERFRREARTTLTLHHDHILPALDYGEHDDWSYLITPYIEYGTLSTRLMQGPLEVDEARQIVDQLADALQYAHDHGVLHRDIKASNVLLRDGTYAYLTDFGLVKSVQDEYSLTRSGFLIGTPEYMAPEIIESPATPRSDIYAFGILTYQMLTNTVPFRGANPVSIVMKHLREAPPPPSRFNPTIPRAVEQVILQTLEKDPERRFRTASAFATAFRQACGVEKPHMLAVEDMTTQSVSLRDEPVVLPAAVPIVPPAPIAPSAPAAVYSTRSLMTRRIGIIIAAAILVLALLLLAASHAFGKTAYTGQSVYGQVSSLSTSTAVVLPVILPMYKSGYPHTE
jgi:serine/threonine protein kinase